MRFSEQQEEGDKVSLEMNKGLPCYMRGGNSDLYRLGAGKRAQEEKKDRDYASGEEIYNKSEIKKMIKECGKEEGGAEGKGVDP